MPVPKLDPYLTFNGNCAEAFRFYEQALGAKIEALMPYSTSAMAAHVPPSHADKLLHARLTIDGQVIMGADAVPGQPYAGLGGFSLSLNYPTAAAAKVAFDALAEGGTIGMPIGKTFWADTFGMVTDRFGVPWMVGCEKEA